MKKNITEINAAAAVMDAVFQQVDTHWHQIWGPIEESFGLMGKPTTKPEFVKFNYSLAVLAINFRSAFDLFSRPQAERIFSHMLQFLHGQLGHKDGFVAVKNAILKYTDAYNSGILKIRNPLQDVATLLYYKIGLENTQQTIVDETYYVPEPKVVEYLTNSLTMFVGKWDYLLQRFELVVPSGQAPQDKLPPQ